MKPHKPFKNHHHDGKKEFVDFKSMTNYYDSKGILKREVFVDWAKKIAENLPDSRTSLRRLYDQVAALRFQVNSENTNPEAVLQPGLGMLHRYAEYQKGRRTIKNETCRFIQDNCEAIGSDPVKFEGFYQLFQSVMAFLKKR